MAPPAATIDLDIFAETDAASFTVPDRLTVEKVAKRRAASGKLVAGALAAADLEQFKGRTSHSHKALAKRWDREYSLVDLARLSDRTPTFENEADRS